MASNRACLILNIVAAANQYDIAQQHCSRAVRALACTGVLVPYRVLRQHLGLLIHDVLWVLYYPALGRWPGLTRHDLSSELLEATLGPGAFV